MTAVMLELAGLAIVGLLVIAGLLPQGRAVRSAQRCWTACGNRKWLSVLLAAVTGFGVSASASAVRVPVPGTHDEFSYLLAADTYAHGRLTNPTHPHWQHFESFHILQQPSYASKYPPAQGLLLALGIVLGGNPIVGVWIGMGLAAGALCWMLQGWLPGRWALFGAMIFALHPGLQFATPLSWGNSYWGGAAAVTGGALLFGALPRLLRTGLFRYGVVLALGAAVLANSRPFEGLVACLVVASVILWQLGTGMLHWSQFARCVCLPTLLVLVPTAAAMAYYNRQVTGRAALLPYQLHEATYAAYPLFLWAEQPAMPAYRHAVLRRFHIEWGLDSYLRQRNLNGFLRTKAMLIAALWKTFCGFTLTIPLIAALGSVKVRSVRLALGGGAVALGTSALVPWMQPLYLAPTVPLLWLLLVQGWRRLRICGRRRSGWGRRLALGLCLLFAVQFTYQLGTHWTREPSGWQWGRQAIHDKVSHTPGKHLVFADYGPTHNTLEEWVYNEANIDAARVVWARAMSAEENQRLIEYFDDRQIWIVDADARPPRLRPVPREKCQRGREASANDG